MRKLRHAALVGLVLVGLAMGACGGAGAGGGGAGTSAAPAPALGTNNAAPVKPTPSGDPYSDYGY
jgi:hypothetical protein